MAIVVGIKREGDIVEHDRMCMNLVRRDGNLDYIRFGEDEPQKFGGEKMGNHDIGRDGSFE